MEREFDLLPLLDHIDPSILSYQEWVNVGMALKHEGYTASDWDNWSLRDPARYRKFECFKKWDTKKARMARETEVTLNGKNYQITIEERSPWNM